MSDSTLRKCIIQKNVKIDEFISVFHKIKVTKVSRPSKAFGLTLKIQKNVKVSLITKHDAAYEAIYCIVNYTLKYHQRLRPSKHAIGKVYYQDISLKVG